MNEKNSNSMNFFLNQYMDNNVYPKSLNVLVSSMDRSTKAKMLIKVQSAYERGHNMK
jgi:hypothetical protein